MSNDITREDKLAIAEQLYNSVLGRKQNLPKGTAYGFSFENFQKAHGVGQVAMGIGGADTTISTKNGSILFDVYDAPPFEDRENAIKWIATMLDKIYYQVEES